MAYGYSQWHKTILEVFVPAIRHLPIERLGFFVFIWMFKIFSYKAKATKKINAKRGTLPTGL